MKETWEEEAWYAAVAIDIQVVRHCCKRVGKVLKWEQKIVCCCTPKAVCKVACPNSQILSKTFLIELFRAGDPLGGSTYCSSLVLSHRNSMLGDERRLTLR